jgi:hypothetical protein
MVNIEEVIVGGDPDLAFLKPVSPLDYTLEIRPKQYDKKVTIATFHAYATIDLMKRHVYLVKSVATRKESCLHGSRKLPCLRLPKELCNIGLGTGVVSVSTKDSSMWALQGVAIRSPKCWEKGRVDTFVLINDDKWDWIMKLWG